ncbi:MAG: prolyl oligopeptidase family serine peptidase [Candidatus Krumholzibacteria bacterium]|nr:prolyl oligopeptidase family serine peptidase [Candidatus Krumholzibacteria bacterium]
MNGSRRFKRVPGMVFGALIAWVSSGAAVPGGVAAGAKPPATRADNVTEVIHGTTIVDPYRWLEDQKSPETRGWIDAQNAYAHSFLDPLPFRESITKRLTELMKIDQIGMPFERGGRYFLQKRSADQDLWVIYMRESLGGEDRVLVDPDTLSADHTRSVGIYDVSLDGKLLAYYVREGGEDEVAVRFLDIDSGRQLAENLPKGSFFGVSITSDKSGFYYSKHVNEIGSRVYYHAMGTDPAGDPMIFGEGYGPDKGIDCRITDDGRYLGIVVFYGSAGQKSEIYYKDLVADGPITALVNDIDARFEPDSGGDIVFMNTDWNAPNGRILAIDLDNPSRENWREIVPERKDAVIEGFSIAGGKIFVNYMENVSSKVRVFEADGTYLREISFPTLGTVGGVSGHWASNEAFFVFTSFHIPTTIYRYDVATGEQQVWARLKVSVDTDQIEVEQVWYASKDGTKIPMFLVHRKGLERNGNNPTLLTGYGGFDVSLTPYFQASAIPWIERGGILAMPSLRGGGEFGEDWHRAGMLDRKQNVYDDFIAAAEWLIAQKYTTSSRLAISGGSNGGLLVGAVMTQRPELFKAVVCSYPLLDMIRYHQFLVAKFWVPEYGSSEDPDQFKVLLAYSPYHNVKKDVKYPATLLITGDADTRVAPLHARKMAALLQARTGGPAPILLLYDTRAGHSGGKPVSKVIEDETDEMSFLCWQLGMK